MRKPFTHQVVSCRPTGTQCGRQRTHLALERRCKGARQRLLRAQVALLLTALAIGACSTRPSATGPSGGTSPVSVNVVAGNSQRVPVNTTLPQAVRVQVLDNSGRPVPNFVLNFVVTSGGGHVFGGVEETNSSGYADEQWTLGPRLGPQTLDARAVNSWSGVAASYGAFTATGTPPNNVLVVTTSGPTGLAVMNADGSGVKAIQTTIQSAEGPERISPTEPALSPDHLHVLFVQSLSGGQAHNLYEVAVNGSPTFITGQRALYNPQWSPDDATYLWESSDQYGSYVAGIPTPIGCTSGSPAVSTQYSFSGDGYQVVYTVFGSPYCTDSLGNPLVALGVYTYPLTNTSAPTAVLANASDPAWSPDGQHIALTYNGHTAVIDPDGNNLKIISNTSYGRVSWSPDSQLWAVDSGFVNADGTNYVAVKGCPCTFAWR